jgi:hypothetical protein
MITPNQFEVCINTEMLLAMMFLIMMIAILYNYPSKAELLSGKICTKITCLLTPLLPSSPISLSSLSPSHHHHTEMQVKV